MLQQDKINALIPLALEVIESVEYEETDKNGSVTTFKILKEKDGEKIVESIYESYIASFGANLTQSGLLPTLVFYQKTKGDGKRILWAKAIYKMLINGENVEEDKVEEDKKDNALIRYVIEKCCNTKKNDEYQLKDFDTEKLDVLETKISRIVVALKLAVRTFKIIKK